MVISMAMVKTTNKHWFKHVLQPKTSKLDEVSNL